MRLYLSLLMMACSIAISPAFAAQDEVKTQNAEEALPQSDKPDAIVPEAAQKIAKLRKSHNEEFKEMLDQIDEIGRRHLISIYQSYNIQSTVKTVEASLDKAALACVDENPEMKESLIEAFKQWHEAVEPVLVEAKAHIDNMIIAQNYLPKNQVKKLLTVSDRLRELVEGSLVKVPVSDKEACEKLLKNMQGSKTEMISMMRETLISRPMMMLEEMEKAKEEQESSQSSTDSDSAPESDEETE